MCFKEIMFEQDDKLKRTKNPNRLRKTYFTGTPIRILCFICILASFQTIPAVSSFHLGFVSDNGVVNILIKSEAPLDIAISLNSTHSSFADKNGLTFELDETTMEGIGTSTNRDPLLQTISNDQKNLDETTEQITTTTIKSNPNDLILQSISEDDENETKRLIKIIYRQFIGKADLRPLAFAAERCEPLTAKVIIENGADVNEIGRGGWCPIHVATYNNCKEIVKMLIENGAEINAKIKIGYSALDIADVYGYGEIVKLISDSVIEGRQYANEVAYEDGDIISI